MQLLKTNSPKGNHRSYESQHNILNSFKVFFYIGQANFKFIRDYIVALVTFKNKEDIIVLVTCKIEDDPIENKGARGLTSLQVDFSDAQGELTPKSVVEFRLNSNSFKLLCMSLLPARIRISN